MPKIEMYQAINNPERVFYGRAEYLDYLRARQRERQSWARLCAGRAKALDRLRGVWECQDWGEVTDFINDHASDLDLLCASEHQFCDFSLEIERETTQTIDWSCMPVRLAAALPPDDQLPDDYPEPRGVYPVWTGRYQHRYRKETPERQAMLKDRRARLRARQSAYDLPHRPAPFNYYTDVLEALGFHCGGGGGGGTYRYRTTIFQMDFDHLRVMERLAA